MMILDVMIPEMDEAALKELMDYFRARGMFAGGHVRLFDDEGNEVGKLYVVNNYLYDKLLPDNDKPRAN